MPDPSTTFAVLLERPDACDARVLARALAQVRKTPLQDQLMVAKSSWGIIAEKLGENEAGDLAAGLKSAGLSVVVFPAAELAVLPAADGVRDFQSLTAALPDIVAAAAIKITTTTTQTVKEGPNAAAKIASVGLFMATGIPIRIGGKEKEVTKTKQGSELVFYLDLYSMAARKRLRVNAGDFNYSYLKERKTYQVMGNFKLLLGDVIAKAPDAWKNQGTRILMSGQPLVTMGYASLVDFERESRWLLSLREKSGKV